MGESKVAMAVRFVAITLVEPALAVVLAYLNFMTVRMYQRFELDFLSFTGIQLIGCIAFMAVAFWLFSCAARPTLDKTIALALGLVVSLAMPFLFFALFAGTLYSFLLIGAYLCLAAVSVFALVKRRRTRNDLSEGERVS